jgi:hypothetical protein
VYRQLVERFANGVDTRPRILFPAVAAAAVVSTGNEEGTTNAEMRRRLPQHRLTTWVLFDGNRWVLSVLVLLFLFAMLLLLGTLAPDPVQAAMRSRDPLETTFQALTTAIITGVTLVVTINQLVLSQELGAVGDQRDRMEGAMTFQQDVESLLDLSVSPPDPASFLDTLVTGISDQAASLRDAVEDDADPAVRQDIDGYVARLRDNADSVEEHLEAAQFGTFDVLHAALDFNYSRKIHEARRLKTAHEAAITDETRTALTELVELLEYFGPAREHFKTLYFQWELINLSRAVSFAAIPALVITISMLLFAPQPGTLSGQLLGAETLVWLTSGTITVALAPFVLLLSFMLRIATVAKRTLAMGPFVLRDTGASDSVDRER